MRDCTVGTIRLSGTDSVNFANSLFRPTQERIENNKRVLDDINDRIEITRSPDGFQAEIADLDLSFLNETPNEKQLHIKVSMEINPPVLTYYSNKRENKVATIIVRTNQEYNPPEDSGFLSVAA